MKSEVISIRKACILQRQLCTPIRVLTTNMETQEDSDHQTFHQRHYEASRP